MIVVLLVPLDADVCRWMLIKLLIYVANFWVSSVVLVV